MAALLFRRRRHDLALLRCLVRRQLRSAVAWQATITALIAVPIAIPLGVLAGRWIWSVIARDGGFVIEPRWPMPAMILLIPSAVILANLVASIPGRAASRTQPALVLRSG